MCYNDLRRSESMMSLVHRILTFFVTPLGYREIILDLLFLLCLVFAWYRPQFWGGFFGAVERAGARHRGTQAPGDRFARSRHDPDPAEPAVAASDSGTPGPRRIQLPACGRHIRARTPHKSHAPFVGILRHDARQSAPHVHFKVSAGAGRRACGRRIAWRPMVWRGLECCNHVCGGTVDATRLASAPLGAGRRRACVVPIWNILRTGSTATGVALLRQSGEHWSSAPCRESCGFGGCAMHCFWHSARQFSRTAGRWKASFSVLPVMAVLLTWMFGEKSPSLNVLLPRVILPVCAVGLFCGIFIGYYNWRGTGNLTLFPYVVNDRTYLSTPTLFWEKLRPPIHYTNPEFDAFYNGWSRNVWLDGRVDSVTSAAKHMFLDVAKVAYFFLWPELLVPFIALPWLLWDKRVRFLIVQIVICFSGMLLVPWSQAHYAAPLTATLFALLTQAVRHLRQFQHSERSVGIGFSRVVVLAALFLAPFHPHVEPLGHPPPEGIDYRAIFERKLKEIPAEHLVIVRYFPERDSNGKWVNYRLSDWVYNGADIDHAKVVWAREVPGMDVRPLLDYFRGRHVWVVEPDAIPPRMTPYLGAPAP